MEDPNSGMCAYIRRGAILIPLDVPRHRLVHNATRSNEIGHTIQKFVLASQFNILAEASHIQRSYDHAPKPIARKSLSQV